MSERVVICSSAETAARFCREERLLEAAARRQGGAGGGRHNGGRPLRRSDRDRRGENQRGPVRSGRVARKKKNHSTAVNGNMSFYQGRLLVGDSILKRAVKASGGFVAHKNLSCYGGATTSSLLRDLEKSCNSLPGKAMVLIGVNDLMQGKAADDVVQGIQNILFLLKQKGVCDILLLTIPPPYKEKKNTVDYQHVNDKLIAIDCHGVKVVPIHQIFVNNDGSINESLFERFYKDGRKDLVHPNRAGLKEILKCLSNRQCLEEVSAEMDGT